jgi:antitoxin component of MazEF toxin-antitoxin module
MGDTAKTRLHAGGETLTGEALLETSEIIFRGERRVVIKFAEIRSADARDGRLILRRDHDEVEIELGTHAEKWAEKIRNPKTVVQKLGIKAGQQVTVLRAGDAAFVDDLEKAGAIVATRAKRNSDAIFYGASTRADLAKLESLRESLAPNGALWIVRPKGVKEITESDVMAAGKAAGLVDVKVVRFSDTHTAEKFVIPVAKRK